jgi:hypothetical protein
MQNDVGNRILRSDNSWERGRSADYLSALRHCIAILKKTLDEGEI